MEKLGFCEILRCWEFIAAAQYADLHPCRLNDRIFQFLPIGGLYNSEAFGHGSDKNLSGQNPNEISDPRSNTLPVREVH